MYLPSITVLLLVAQLKAESNIVEQLYEACDGGYCLPKHLCPTGIFNSGRILERNGLIKLRVDEENECGDFMKICCKESNSNSESTSQKCGISNPQGLVYDVKSNLTYAKYAEFPWTVAIFRISPSSNNNELTHIGGGALIHPKFVLTTAHTMDDAESHRYVARFGEWNMKSEAEIYPAQDIEIEEHIPHPLYREKRMPENDIALAVLTENVIYSEHIRPLCLPSVQDVFDGQRCIAAGWGWDLRTEHPASVMKRIELNVALRRRCQMLHREMDGTYSLRRGIMCTHAAEDQNTCIKDNGTPLACQRNDGSYVLAGIAIWRLNCVRSASSRAFVDVAKFACWIHDTITTYEDLSAEEEDKMAVSDEHNIIPIRYASSYPERNTE